MKRLILFLVLLGIIAILFNLLKIVAGAFLLIIGVASLLLAIIFWIIDKVRSE